MNANYYDLALCLYALYYRTVIHSIWPPHAMWLIRGDFHTNQRWCLESILKRHLFARNSSLGGLMLRALDGRPEMWDWLHSYTRQMFDMWVKRPRKGSTALPGSA
jgi:hypothetical protein